MKTVMIINEETDKLESTYQVKDEKVNEEVDYLKNNLIKTEPFLITTV